MRKLRSFFIFIILIATPFISFSQKSKKKELQKFYVSVYFSHNFCNASTYGKYLVNYSNTDYMEAFEEAFMENLGYKNVVLVKSYDTVNIDPKKHFLIYIEELKLYESVKSETVSDDTFTETFTYYDCDASTQFRIEKLPDGNIFKDSDVQATKSESVNNRRSFLDILFGLNKNGAPYHVTELSDDVFITLSKRSGRKTANKSTRIITRILKEEAKNK